ncbi:MAG: BamA/TamA family outer membrane protein [Luteitalea sp.]|nr:BamA/TamA family outer membrane protein [Luteitalea sp.]
MPEMNRLRYIAFLFLTSLTFAGVAGAQESRAEALRQEREEKQRTAQPYDPNTLETVLKAVERSGVPLITRDGVYAKLGSLTTGSGFAYGAGFRTHRFLSREAGADAWAGASIKGYWATEARVRFPNLADGRVLAEGYGRRHEYPQEDYFGLGPASARDAQTDYTLRVSTFGARAAVRAAPIVAIGGGIEYLEPRVGNGKDQAQPSIGELFDEASTPGLSGQPNYLRTIAFVDIDWRRPLNARSGGWYRAEFSRYDDRDLGAFTFNRLDLDLRQFVGFLSERRVLFARAFASTSDTATDQQMPFYLMPTLGGNDSLRGFRDYRFRGPHAVLFQGEYRFEIWSGLDGALFYDAGKVAMRRADLGLRDLESDYGFGFRFNTDNGVVVRVDAAFGSRDGKHLWIVFGGTF